jgi:hypothetical protein
MDHTGIDVHKRDSQIYILAEADAALGGERAHAKVASECQGLARLRDRDRQATPSNMCRQLNAAARDYP